MKLKVIFLVLIAFIVFTNVANAQITERPRPNGWENLVNGGRFMDRFLPMPVMGELTSNTWGAPAVVPRYTDNGIEDNTWSYWGGNIKLGDDGKYHLFLCGWLESSPKGHATWHNSTVFHATADNSFGPYALKDTIGPGHNPEVFQLKDGRYVIYYIGGYYISDSFDGPWKNSEFEFDNRDRRIIEGLSNLTFAQREDGTYLMVCRGGGVWFSESGISSYNQVSDKRAYPPVEGRFEDPVIWRTNVQYHLIVNDWLGRIAWYLRSKDGINWITDPGEAYLPGVAKYEDGTVVDWFKYERIKMFQDEYGRATQAHFAVIDTLKREDKSSDNHSSKHIIIPLTVGRLITILDKKQITADTKSIRVKIAAEEGFDPNTDMDLKSLKFGASEEVNFGKGCTVEKTEKSGNDLIVTFKGAGNGFADDNFAGKLLGKTSDGKLLFGYARLPWVDYIEPALSARMPVITASEQGFKINIEVQNFGQVASKIAEIKVVYIKDDKEVEVASGKVAKLKSFEKTNVELECGKLFDKGVEYDFIITINPDDRNPVLLHGKSIPVE